MAKFKAALDSNKHKAQVEADMEAAKKAGVSGTPAFTVNGYFISGAQPFAKFDKTIKYAMKQ
jgi:predicted DsbA family dithiol-disulfide isomerase